MINPLLNVYNAVEKPAKKKAKKIRQQQRKNRPTQNRNRERLIPGGNMDQPPGGTSPEQQKMLLDTILDPRNPAPRLDIGGNPVDKTAPRGLDWLDANGPDRPSAIARQNRLDDQLAQRRQGAYDAVQARKQQQEMQGPSMIPDPNGVREIGGNRVAFRNGIPVGANVPVPGMAPGVVQGGFSQQEMPDAQSQGNFFTDLASREYDPVSQPVAPSMPNPMQVGNAAFDWANGVPAPAPAQTTAPAPTAPPQSGFLDSLWGMTHREVAPQNQPRVRTPAPAQQPSAQDVQGMAFGDPNQTFGGEPNWATQPPAQPGPGIIDLLKGLFQSYIPQNLNSMYPGAPGTQRQAPQPLQDPNRANQQRSLDSFISAPII